MLNEYIHYTDPAHGWLKVPLTELKELGIIDDITGCSYVQGLFAYLEEDHDGTLFLERYEEEQGKADITNKHTNNYSKIRRYHNYNPDSVKYTLKKLED